MLYNLDDKKYIGIIYDILLISLKQWSLKLKNFVDFGSYGMIITLNNCNRVVTKLKKEVD